jgi:hypothetical protein
LKSWLKIQCWCQRKYYNDMCSEENKKGYRNLNSGFYRQVYRQIYRQVYGQFYKEVYKENHKEHYYQLCRGENVDQTKVHMGIFWSFSYQYN